MRTYTGDQSSSIATAMKKCDPMGPLMINVVKLYSTPDGQAFTALGRVYSGAVRTGQKVKVRRINLARGRRKGRGSEGGGAGRGGGHHANSVHMYILKTATELTPLLAW